MLDTVKNGAYKFKQELKKNVTTAALAALGFIIALVWRDAIQEAVNKIVIHLGVSETLYFYKFLVAFIVTVICVAGLVFLSRWSEKKD